MVHRLAHVVAAAGALLVAGLVAPAAVAAAPVYAPIDGGGSSWAANAVAEWAATEREQGLRVDYAANGSSRGRADFAAGDTDFAVTDLTYADAGEPDPSRSFRYLPLAAGAVAFPYQVKVDGALRRDIRLSGRTLADIFRGAVTNWNDPAITADNNGHRVAPDLPITPVVRADASASTFRLTDWFSTRFPGRWAPFSDAGATAFFPAPAGRTVAVTGSAGVTNRVRQSYANGSIGYVENTEVRSAGLPVVAVENATHHFLTPEVGNVGLSLLRARIGVDGRTDLHPLYGDPDARAYPLSYFTYGIVATGAADPRLTTAKRQAEVDFFGYAVCDGQSAVQPQGFAALPLNLTRLALQALTALRRADPAVDGTALRLTRCMNPTIAHGRDGSVSDDLAATVPAPADCSRRGAGPCPVVAPAST